VSPPRTPAKPPQPSPRVVTPLITYHHVSPKGNPTSQAPVSSRTRSKSFPVQIPPDPVSNRTRSRTHQVNTVKPLATSGRRFPLAFLAHWACPVVDLDTGKILSTANSELTRSTKRSGISPIPTNLAVSAKALEPVPLLTANASKALTRSTRSIMKTFPATDVKKSLTPRLSACIAPKRKTRTALASP
jgi:hypothetical protein